MITDRSSRRRPWALVGLLVALVAAMAVAVPPADATRPALRWSPCYQEVTDQSGTPYECATLRAPLDYDHPHRARIDIAVVRIPARDEDARLGAILLNPGGPGGSGIDFALGFGPFAGLVWGEDVADRFDIVGFDPRGILRSTPLICFDTFDEAVATSPDTAFPLTRPEHRDWGAAVRALTSACDDVGGPIANHMSTANVARDMDLLRRAMGDRELNFAGLSYGSYLGTTYANLFPDRVRAVVVDGVLDPVAWADTTGDIPFSTRLHSDEGAQETLERLFRLCNRAGPDACALAPRATSRFARVAWQLRRTPLTIVDPDTDEIFTLRYSDLIGFALGILYDPSAYPGFAEVVAEVEGALAAPDPRLASAELAGAMARPPSGASTMAEPPYPNYVEGFPGVACVDTTNPDTLRTWRIAGARADRQYGYFGRIWTWASAPCVSWPARDRDRHVGPWDARTASPVLVIGNLWDPATRYEGAQAVRRLLPNSSLLTLQMPGHTSLGLSGCTGFLTGQYFLDPTIAPVLDGVTCPPSFDPFVPADGVASRPGGDRAALDAAAERTPADLVEAAQRAGPLPTDALVEVRDLLPEPFGGP